MRDVAIVSFAQTAVPGREARDETEMLVSVIGEALGRAGLSQREIGFTCSGSCDFLVGRPFSFVTALDAVGAWPPIQESHVEMDGAWALYEAWVRLQHGDIDTALVYAFGKSSLGPIDDVLSLQLDPYVMGPLWPDAISLAALQARALLDSGRVTERELTVLARERHGEARSVEELLAEPYHVAPLRAHDCPVIADGAAAVVMVAGDRARKLSERPAWIRGIDHRVELHSLGARDLSRSVSTEIAAGETRVKAGPVDVAELHAPFAHQEFILRESLGLTEETRINPSGGALRSNPIMVAGLARIGTAAERIFDKSARRAVAHATSGPCLQQNLVCVLEEK